MNGLLPCLKRVFLISLCLAGIACSAACSNNAMTYPNGIKQTHSDPYEKYNRAMFTFNIFFDRHFMKPVATFYKKVMPRPFNDAINNFFNNLDEVPTVINDILQANFYQAMSDTWRFGINSTVGVGGLFDVASHMGLVSNYETFGLTMAKWGWQPSHYLVLPIIGPSTVRGTLGLPVDWLTSISPYLFEPATNNIMFVLEMVNARAQLLQYQNVFKQAALDPYVFSRNAYLQRRAYLINRNNHLDDPYSVKETQYYQEKSDFLDE